MFLAFTHLRRRKKLSHEPFGNVFVTVRHNLASFFCVILELRFAGGDS
jgi:hypothetical protein